MGKCNTLGFKEEIDFYRDSCEYEVVPFGSNEKWITFFNQLF